MIFRVCKFDELDVAATFQLQCSRFGAASWEPRGQSFSDSCMYRVSLGIPKP
jgi:hypothetical protein